MQSTITERVRLLDFADWFTVREYPADDMTWAEAMEYGRKFGHEEWSYDSGESFTSITYREGDTLRQFTLSREVR